MNAWHVFAWVYQSFNAPFLAVVNAQAANLSATVMLPATLLATFYIAFGAYQDLYTGLSGNPVMDLVRRCMRVALILACLVSATYVAVVSNMLLTELPNGLAAAVTGGTAVGAAAFDKMANQAWAATVEIWKNLSVWNVKSLILGGYSCLFLGFAGFSICLAFSLWLITQVGLGLLVVVGPLAIACLIMPQTAKFFNGWLASVVTGIVAQVMIVTTVSVLLTTVTTTLTQILQNAVPGATTADDIGTEIHQLSNAGFMFIISGIVCLSLVPIARAIGGGAATEIGGVTRWATGMVSGGASHVAGAAAGAVGSAAKSAGSAMMRSITPAGKAP